MEQRKPAVRVRPFTPKHIEQMRRENEEENYSPRLILTKLTGQTESSLERLQKLELTVDCEEIPLHKFGDLCPCVKELKLNGSHLETFRDLGTGWQRVEIIWVARCGLASFEGISSFPSIKEIYAAFNSVKGLYDLMFNETLEVLDLEGNEIENLEEIENLRSCENLWSLTLEGNPIARNQNYRDNCLNLLKQIEIFDETPRSSPQQDSLQLPELVEPDELEIVNTSVRDSVRSKRKSFDKRPQSASLDNSYSQLTEQVFSGNPIRAMKYNRKRKAQEGGVKDILSLINDFKTESNNLYLRKNQVPNLFNSRRIAVKRQLNADYSETK